MRKKKNLIVIDDSPAILMFMASVLEEYESYNVYTEDSAEAALNHISEDPDKFSAVLTDLNMPGMDGMELIRHLGEANFKGGIIIISAMDARVVTLASQIAKRNQVCLIGSLSKPIQLDALSKALNKLEQLEEKSFLKYQKLTKLELIAALKDKRLKPYYQPKLNSKTNTVESIEVLARIVKPGQTSPILPGCFLSIAEDCDLVDQMTLQIIAEVAEDYSTLQGIFGSGVKVGFNLSPNQLSDLSFPTQLAQILKDYKIDSRQVILEITEEYALKTTVQLESLNRLRMMGYGVSLDDFGTGFTNVHQLRDLPFTEVKVDRSFVTNIHVDTFCQVVVKSLYDLSDQLGITLVAEGVENIEEYQYLSEHYENALIQGYLVCRPRSIESLKVWYQSWLLTMNRA